MNSQETCKSANKHMLEELTTKLNRLECALDQMATCKDACCEAAFKKKTDLLKIISALRCEVANQLTSPGEEERLTKILRGLAIIQSEISSSPRNKSCCNKAECEGNKDKVSVVRPCGAEKSGSDVCCNGKKRSRGDADKKQCEALSAASKRAQSRPRPCPLSCNCKPQVEAKSSDRSCRSATGREIKPCGSKEETGCKCSEKREDKEMPKRQSNTSGNRNCSCPNEKNRTSRNLEGTLGSICNNLSQKACFKPRSAGGRDTPQISAWPYQPEPISPERVQGETSETDESVPDPHTLHGQAKYRETTENVEDKGPKSKKVTCKGTCAAERAREFYPETDNPTFQGGDGGEKEPLQEREHCKTREVCKKKELCSHKRKEASSARSRKVREEDSFSGSRETAPEIRLKGGRDTYVDEVYQDRREMLQPTREVLQVEKDQAGEKYSRARSVGRTLQERRQSCREYDCDDISCRQQSTDTSDTYSSYEHMEDSEVSKPRSRGSCKNVELKSKQKSQNATEKSSDYKGKPEKKTPCERKKRTRKNDRHYVDGHDTMDSGYGSDYEADFRHTSEHRQNESTRVKCSARCDGRNQNERDYEEGNYDEVYDSNYLDKEVNQPTYGSTVAGRGGKCGGNFD